MQPTLGTRSLVLQPITEGDVDALHRLWRMPGVRRFLWDDRTIDRQEAAATVADAIGLRARGLGLWCLRPRKSPDGELVGCAGLFPVRAAALHDPRLADGVEPLVALAPEHWHRGYATETLQALVAYTFGQLGLRELVAVVDVPNAASQRLVERIGFEPFGESPGPRYPLRSYRLRAAKAERCG